MGLGWRFENLSGFRQRVTSPGGLAIMLDTRHHVFLWGSMKESDFGKLARAIILDMDEAIHERRGKINDFRRTTRELRQVIGEVVESAPKINLWSARDDNGVRRMKLDYGPVVVEAAICDLYEDTDTAWHVTLDDGRQAPYKKEGLAKDFESAKVAVLETVMNWCDELCETGRHAMRIYTKIKGVLG